MPEAVGGVAVADEYDFGIIKNAHAVDVEGDSVSSVAKCANGEEIAVRCKSGHNVGFTCIGAEDIADEFSLVGSGHGMATRDFDAEGVGREPSVSGGETGVYKRVGARCIDDQGRASCGGTRW